jgi:choline dehydrogenase-like flavoprotein
MVGGATSMYCGSAARPPAWFKERYGVDLDAQVEEAVRELRIKPLPPALRGQASTRLAEAAHDLGYDWSPLDKFMDPERCPNRFDCGAKCMLGCRCGAKWNAGEWVDEAVTAGARLITQAHVTGLAIDAGQVGGVRGRLGDGRDFEIEAQVVVLAAGGIGSPLILQHAGLAEAGRGMAMDTTVMVYGTMAGAGIGREPPMTWAWTDDENGYMLSTLIDPWLLYPLITALKGVTYPLTWPRWGRTLGVMIKLKDEISGSLSVEGRISKGMTAADRDRLNRAAILARKILLRAGCDESSIFVTPPRGTHPSATVRIGHTLDKSLQTEVKNLYVCDASVFPEALDRPTVLTIIGLGKRLAAHLTGAGGLESA